MTFLNKKGFFMTETLMVIVFATIIFTFLYISVIPLIGTYNDKTLRESDIDILYKLYSVRKMINKDINKKDLVTGNINNITCENTFKNKEYCTELMKILELNNYVLIYTDSISENYNNLINIDDEIEAYLKKYKEDDENALILLDKDKHTIAHLNYIDPDMKLGDLLEYKSNKKMKKTKNVCKPLYLDSDNINYFSGTNECVDFNYMWYSGKLWRITAIYPDGTLKMVTQNGMTTMAYYETNDSTFSNSYVNNWLNEEFLEGLYNHSNIIDTTKKWDVSITSSPSIIPDTKTEINNDIGLLNSFEYYYASQNSASETDNYLNIQYSWFLMNAKTSAKIYTVKLDGEVNDSGSASNVISMIRPAIYVKSSVEFSGNGTIDNPFRIVGDKIGGQQNDLINTRLSGEYIKLKNGNNEQKFRIIDIEDNKTKIIAMDYADNGAKRQFATDIESSSTVWGSGTTTGENTWYTYLNNTYYPDLVRTYGNLFDKGIYYTNSCRNNYMTCVCETAVSGSIKDCEKTSNTGILDVGMPRYGEMFATQQMGGYESSSAYWLLNRYRPTTAILYVNKVGSGANYNGTNTYAARPTLYLKSSVKIKSGKGTENDPYIVGL